MVRAWYFYALTPVGIVVATAVLLTIPYLALVAFALVSLATLAALAWAIVFVPYEFARAIRRRWNRRRDPSLQAGGTSGVYGPAYAKAAHSLDYRAPQLGHPSNVIRAPGHDGTSDQTAFRMGHVS